QEQQPAAPKPPEPAQQGVNVKLAVTDRNCWMRIVVDDTKAFEGEVPPGAKKEFRGNNSVFVRLGDPGAVQVTVNGYVYGFLSTESKPLDRTFTAGEGGGNT
ncbi:MAG: DUF4115 domain-containing protein, partial [Firmicutes bacterium]|nr:DUF4115 domain-containing protein [Bacillota bacterium]